MFTFILRSTFFTFELFAITWNLILYVASSAFYDSLNSGGVSAKTFYIPMNNLFIKFFDIIDQILVKFFPKIFAMGRRLVLIKK